MMLTFVFIFLCWVNPLFRASAGFSKGEGSEEPENGLVIFWAAMAAMSGYLSLALILAECPEATVTFFHACVVDRVVLFILRDSITALILTWKYLNSI